VSNTFVKGPVSEYSKYLTDAKRWLATTSEENIPEVSVSFEEYLGATFRERIGPFVALGNPEDYLPHEGAVVTYANNEGWYEYFERLAERAACMVMPVSNSDNLKRELSFIRREGLQRRLFIMTNLWEVPRGIVRFYAWLFKPYPWIFLQLYGPPRIDEKATWEGLAENVGKLGFDLGDDPGRGGVVTFDLDGKAMVLVRGAKTPSEFVEPVREYLVGTLGMDLGEVSVKNEAQLVAPSTTDGPNPKTGLFNSIDNRHPVAARWMRRVLFLLWLVLSVLWVVLIYVAGSTGDDPRPAAELLGQTALGPPAIIFAIGWILVWPFIKKQRPGRLADSAQRPLEDARSSLVSSVAAERRPGSLP
jgi:hypothetical protein